MKTTFTSLLFTSMFTLSSPFGAEAPALDQTESGSHQETISPFVSVIALPSRFANDFQLREVLNRIAARNDQVGPSVFSLFKHDHPRHKRWRYIEEIFKQGLEATNAQDADLNATLSDMYNQIALAEIRFHVDHMNRFPSPAGKAVFEYDVYTLNHILDWIQTNLTEGASITEMANAHLVFNLLTDSWYGSKEFFTAVKEGRLSEEGVSDRLFAFLEKQRAGVVADRELTLQDVKNLIEHIK